ncbi:MAG: hypothetical protein IJX80_05565 [Clostridia bacterium]|nr:hypothetical protein [Clostridia bacterium]
MNHTAFRKYLALICILACVLLIACTPGDGTGNTETTTAEETTGAPATEATYKVTIVDDQGTPIQGAIVQFNEGDKPFAITDANGIVTVNAKTATYTVSIVVAGYEVESSYAFAANATELNVTLKTTDDGKVEYKVTVIDENGKAIDGVKVQLCIGDLCQLPAFTDENGIAIVNAAEDTYTAKITKDGYTGDSEYSFPDGSRELTVTLTKN